MHYYIARDCIVNGSTKMWTLQNILTGAYVQAEDEDVKRKIKQKQVDIANLTLTSDNRLVKASEYKFEAFKEMMQAPQSLLGQLKAPTKEVAASIESSLDREISSSLKTYTAKYGKYVTVQETDSDRNLIVAQFKVGEDTFLLIKYQKVVYGVDETGNAFFDCLLGVEALRCGQVCEHIKAVPSKLSYYLEACRTSSGTSISDEMRTAYDSIQLHCKANGRFQLDNDDERMLLATAIMKALGDQMDEVVLANPVLANNVDVANCIYYDETKKEYVKMVSSCIGVGVIGTVAIGAISAIAIATNPEILQTGLLAKIANVGTTQQIINAVKNFSLVGGGLTGSLATVGAMKQSGFIDSGKTMRKKIDKLRVEEGKTFNDYNEVARRKEREKMRQRALEWEAQQSAGY